MTSRAFGRGRTIIFSSRGSVDPGFFLLTRITRIGADSSVTVSVRLGLSLELALAAPSS
jgi:hypothetical protein